MATLGDVGYRGPDYVEVEDATYGGSLDDRYLTLNHSSHFLRNDIPRRYPTNPLQK